MLKPLEPVGHKLLAVTAASAEVTGLNQTDGTIRLYWKGTTECAVTWGTSAQTAVIDGTQLVLAPGAVESFSKGSATRLAAIAASGGSGTLYITTGNGAL